MKNGNRLVIVDSGHGGIDSGAVNGDILEKKLTLEISNYIYNRLNELGIPSVMTRDSDVYLPKIERINKVRQVSKDDPNVILISNHINAGGGEGAEVVYALRNDSTLADMILDNIGEAGQIKRKVYQRRLPENPSKDYYYIIRDTAPRESILIEYGFIDNENDLNKLKNNLDSYAESVVKALADYLGVNYNLPDKTNNGKYIVEKGDTLYGIAKKYNVSVESIKKANNLISDNLNIGQELIIPNEVQNINDIYIVKKGDTLYAIANKYNISIEKLKKINGLVGNTLSIGEQLLVPSTNNKDKEIYVVEKGDTLYSISSKYGIDVSDLVEYNSLKDLTIYVGQELFIPPKKEMIYTVKKGDSLYSIANRYNVEVDDIIRTNSLGSITLSIGQELIIPAK